MEITMTAKFELKCFIKYRQNLNEFYKSMITF
jgi:hypothetical protein